MTFADLRKLGMPLFGFVSLIALTTYDVKSGNLGAGLGYTVIALGLYIALMQGPRRHDMAVTWAFILSGMWAGFTALGATLGASLKVIGGAIVITVVIVAGLVLIQRLENRKYRRG